ncbi:MAG: hypothetical protein M3O50_12515 [Myxococcota bacterium]|nr:hypothetical protein [Myxococcota bacterium]
MLRSLAGFVAVSLAGCGGSLPHPPYAPQATSALTLVDAAPPPGRIELIPDRPRGANAWIEGEWIIRRGRWYWLLGHWVTTPPGAKFAPWVFVRSPDGTAYFAPSAWVDAAGNPIDSPAPIAFATANTSAVFDPGGDLENVGRNIKSAPPLRRRESPAFPTDRQPAP